MKGNRPFPDVYSADEDPPRAKIEVFSCSPRGRPELDVDGADGAEGAENEGFVTGKEPQPDAETAHFIAGTSGNIPGA